MKSEDYVVSFKLVKDDGRCKYFSVWVAYLPIKRKQRWGKNRTKRNKVLYSKDAVDRCSVYGNRPKFFLPTPIGICVLYGESALHPNKVRFTLSCMCSAYLEEMTLNLGEVYSGYDVSKLHTLTGEGLMDFKVKLTNLFRENQGVFKAEWKLKKGYYDGIQMWDFHLGWDYWNGAYHYKFTPNKNFK